MYITIVHHNCRALALTVQFMSSLKIMLIVVYFPCFKVDPNYRAEISDCLGFIEKYICDNIFDDLVILGDFNFNCDARLKVTYYPKPSPTITILCAVTI